MCTGKKQRIQTRFDLVILAWRCTNPLFVSKQHVHFCQRKLYSAVFACSVLISKFSQLEYIRVQELSNIRLWSLKVVPRQDKTIFVCKCGKTKPRWLKMLNRDRLMILFTQPEDKCKNFWLNKQIFVISICKIIWFGCILNYRLTELAHVPAQGLLHHVMPHGRGNRSNVHCHLRPTPPTCQRNTPTAVTFAVIGSRCTPHTLTTFSVKSRAAFEPVVMHNWQQSPD